MAAMSVAWTLAALARVPENASGANPLLSQAAVAALGAGAQVGVLLPFSRKHESEADYIGILLAAEAGYDPRESVALWQRMEQEFLSTHPSDDRRIAALEAEMPNVIPIYEANRRGK